MDCRCGSARSRARSSGQGRARSGQLRDRYPHELSAASASGSTSRAHWALRPRLVILDEAVSALDKSVEAQVLNMLVDLKTELSLTYVFISHDLNVVQYLSDRRAGDVFGKIVELGPVEAIYSRSAAIPTRARSCRRGRRWIRAGAPTKHRSRVIRPIPSDPPSGCRFRTRCPFAEEVCARVEPPLTETGRQEVACHMRVAGSGHSKAMA